MNKRDLAGVLVKAIGAWMIAFGLLEFIGALWSIIPTTGNFGFQAFVLAVPMIAVLRIGIGLHLFFKGSWITDKLVQIDAHDD